MRVLLAEPPTLFLEGRGHARAVLPLGLASLAAVLRADHDVALLLPDSRPGLGPDPWAEVVDAAVGWRPDVVGITAVTATFGRALELVARVRVALPGVPVVLGGPHVSFFPDDAARRPGVSAVVVGEGEASFPALLAVLEAARKGARSDPASVAGVVCADTDGCIRRGPPPVAVEELDRLPVPDRESILWRDGLPPSFYGGLITMRGCPYRCVFCAVPSGPAGRVRFRSARAVAEELRHLVDRHAIPYAFFHDSVFTLDPKRVLETCDALAERGVRVPFAVQTRADLLDGELLDRLAGAGLHQILLGIESGDPESLRRIRKGHSLERVRDAVREVTARGIRCAGFFIVGFPWEGRDAMLRTAEFACGLGLDSLALFSATPLPGSGLFELAGATAPPAGHDFREPGVNLTALSDEAYADLYREIRERFDAYNLARCAAAAVRA